MHFLIKYNRLHICGNETIRTVSVFQVWYINGSAKTALPKEELGKFYCGDCYVVLYTYHSGDKKEEFYLTYWIGKHSFQVISFLHMQIIKTWRTDIFFSLHLPLFSMRLYYFLCAIITLSTEAFLLLFLYKSSNEFFSRPNRSNSYAVLFSGDALSHILYKGSHWTQYVYDCAVMYEINRLFI